MFELILSKIFAAILAPVLLLSSLAGLPALEERVYVLEDRLATSLREEKPAEPQLLGSYNTVAGKKYYLYAGGIGTTDTSVTLTSFTQPVNNYKLSMTDFGSIGYITIEPTNETKQEFASFTGVSQNADGTATLTGVTRGLAFVSPYTASSTLRKTHSGGSIVILSNPPQLYEELATRSNDETISGDWTFSSTSAPQYDFNPNFSSQSSTTFASIGFVASTSYSGTVDASETVKGIVELATALETGSSTSLGGTAARLAIPASVATDTPQNCVTVGCVVVTQIGGKIRQTFLDLTEAFIVTAAWIFNGSATFNATTTIAAASTSAPLILRGLPYTFPSTRAASGTVPIENGGGNLTFQYLDYQKVAEVVYSGNTATTTINVPARRNYLVRFYLTGRSTQTAARLSFNADEGLNYGSRTSLDRGTFQEQYGDRYINIDGSAGTTTRSFYEMKITNEASRAKIITWTGTTYNSSLPTQAGTDILGTGVWNNTSAQISSITLAGAISATISAGSIIEVYASKE